MEQIIVSALQKLVKELRNENGIINEIIRDDVFSILQSKCTVLYYPLPDEDCDAFHIEKPVNGKKEQFVFINTHNTRERQAFSAAHELGHIWNVDKYLHERLKEIKFDTEDVINRFAAELLMPEELFQNALDEYLNYIQYEGPGIKVFDLVKIIVYLMNYFFVPYKSVVFRFNELKRLDASLNNKILIYKDSELVTDIIKAEQYTRLGIRNEIKSLDNLQEYIYEVEKGELINKTKIENIKSAFDIQDVVQSGDEVINF